MDFALHNLDFLFGLFLATLVLDIHGLHSLHIDIIDPMPLLLPGRLNTQLFEHLLESRDVLWIQLTI